MVERRDAYSRHYDLGNGRFVAAASLSPINYVDAAGSWQPIQTPFQATAAGFAIRESSLQRAASATTARR